MKIAIFTLLLTSLVATTTSAQQQQGFVAAKLSPESLSQLVSPIALYPDALIALILPASTVPSDVVLGARYLAGGGDTTQIADLPWDDSVKSLTRYAILPRMLDKGRAQLSRTNGEYHYNCPLDQRFLTYVGIDADELLVELKKGGSDTEILEWILQHAVNTYSEQEIASWSTWQIARAPTSVEAREYFQEMQKVSAPIRRIILLLALVSLVGVPYTTLIPIFAGTILKGGPHTLGLLMSSVGAGAFLGALWLAGRRSVLGLGMIIPCSTMVFSLGIIGFALSRSLWLSMLFLFLGGGAFMIQMASSNTILQTIVDNDKRGRVMSFYMMAFMGTSPFGSLLAGSLSEHLGAPLTVVLGGICCLVGGALFLSGLEELRVSIRPIYRRIGILPELTAAEINASQLTFEARD